MRNYNNLAIDYISEYAKDRKAIAHDSIKHVCAMSDISQETIDLLFDSIRQKARIALHFHPFRLSPEGQSVIDALLESGFYKNQFETRISNGSLTAYIGGKRDQWENLLFGDVYKKHEISFSERPKYGALDLIGHLNGPSPRFGSCYFLLKPSLSKYASFCYPDSYINPEEKGTLDYFDGILAALLSECFERDYALGQDNIRPHQFVENILNHLLQQPSKPPLQVLSRNLDHYIEAQVHTEIDLLEDVEFLVADASYQATSYEMSFREICERFQIQFRWSNAYELAVSEVPKNFRGKNMPEVAALIAENGKINAYLIGKAEKHLHNTIKNEVEVKEKSQQLKYLWHTLVKYGRSGLDDSKVAF